MEWTWLSLGSHVVLIWTLLATPFLLIWLYTRAENLKLQKKKYKLPPGPPTWPIIGHIHLLVDSKKAPHQITMALAKTYGPTMLLKIGVQNMVFVSDPELSMEFLKAHDHIFSYRPPMSVKKYLIYGNYHLTIGQQGDYHTFFRKLMVTELLSRKKLQAFEEMRMEEQALVIRETFEASVRNESKPVHMRSLLNTLTLNVVTRMAFSKKFFGIGVPQNGSRSQEKWKMVIPEMIGLFPEILFEDCFPPLTFVDRITGTRKRMQACFARIDALLQDLLDEHKQHLDNLSPEELAQYEPRDFMDVVLLMRNGEEAHHITDMSVKAISMDLMVAGSETSAMVVEWAMAELLTHPDSLKKLQEEMDSVVGKDRCVTESDTAQMPLLAAVIKETFRLHEPLPWLLPHSSLVDCKVGGYDIPANSFVNFDVYGMSRSASLWKFPLNFIPERFLSSELEDVTVKGTHAQLMPFGSGRRMCPGILMSHILIHSTLARLVHSFDWLLRDGIAPHEFDMSESFGTTAAMKTPLQAVPKPRLPLHLYEVPHIVQ